ncbi:conserved hypothetical protein, partial [Trichinella spiralis]|uniref:hypothetical protein n=1 Tax=Trichinella spiralis TaxID=6334 RepID=UPI0001EFEA1E
MVGVCKCELNGASGLIKSILDLEKSVQHTLMLIIQVVFVYNFVIIVSVDFYSFFLLLPNWNSKVTTVVNLKRNANQQCCQRIIDLLCLCIVNRWKSSHSLYLARDEMAAEYDELLRQVEHFQMMNFLDNAIQL